MQRNKHMKPQYEHDGSYKLVILELALKSYKNNK